MREQPGEDQTDWLTVSESILRLANVSSIDDLLEEALDAWLEKASPDLRWQVAIELYMAEQVTSGRAAEIAGLNYFVFEKKLKTEGIQFLEAVSVTSGEAKQQRSLISAVFNIPNP